MSIKDRILADLKQAMRDQKAQQVEALRYLLSQIKNKEIELRPNPLTEAHIYEVIQRLLKQRQEALELYRQGQREDLAAKEEFEITLLKSYLPKPLDEAELEALIQQAIRETAAQGPKDMGRVMKFLQDKAPHRFEASQAAQRVKQVLSQLSAGNPTN